MATIYINQQGWECYLSTICPENGQPGEVRDFIRHPDSLMKPPSGMFVEAGMRDLYHHLCHNREIHVPRMKRFADELRPQIEGKPIILAGPGPSIRKLAEFEGELPPIVAMNQAISLCRPDYCFITERNAKHEWLDSDGELVPWVPEAPLVTSPDADSWLCDYWPDDKRFYAYVPFYECPADPRVEISDLRERIALFSYFITPIIALSWLVYMNPSKVILVGHDFAMSMEGEIYPGVQASNHPNRHDAKARPFLGVDGKLCKSNPSLVFHADIMRGTIYWTERTGRIPVLNASGGILDWRPTPLADAIANRYEPIVDKQTGKCS